MFAHFLKLLINLKSYIFVPKCGISCRKQFFLVKNSEREINREKEEREKEIEREEREEKERVERERKRKRHKVFFSSRNKGNTSCIVVK